LLSGWQPKVDEGLLGFEAQNKKIIKLTIDLANTKFTPRLQKKLN
jgi:hypothetical protein